MINLGSKIFKPFSLAGLITLLILIISSCSISKVKKRSHPWPIRINNLKQEIRVEHSMDTVYASLNKKDPEKRGRYQLQFSTKLASKSDDIIISEFGAYLLINDSWEFRSIYNRPFNDKEFAEWYDCKDAVLKKGKSYTDNDNWLAKTNQLSGDTIVSLWYFIGTNKQGEKVYGASEVVGVLKESE